MKIKALFRYCFKTGIGLFLVTSHAFAQNTALNQLLVKKRFPELEKAIAAKTMSKKEKDLYRVFLLNAYGQPQASNQLMATVRQSGIVKKGDSLDYFMHVTECDNYVKLFNYKNAFGQMQVLLSDYASFYSEKEFKEEKESIVTWQFLSDQKPQVLTKNSDTKLPLKKDLAGLWRLPVTMNDTAVNFVFDTGAGFSVITSTYAKKMGVRIIENAVIPVTSGLTGMVNMVPLGIAPKLVLGNVVAENVVFLVFPDEALSFANGAYVIQGILGLPVIKEFEEFSIEKEELFIPAKPAGKKLEPNMILDQLKPVIYMKHKCAAFNDTANANKTGVKGELLPYTFDSGANTSDFSDNFYKAYKAEIDARSKKITSSFGGAGGVVTKEVLAMPSLEFEVMGKTATFKDAQVNTEEISTNGVLYYGNIGQDLIGQFGKMTMNFNYSYILFE